MMTEKLAMQKNKIIKQFLFLNIIIFILIFVLPINWIIELVAFLILLFFIPKYLNNIKNPFHWAEYRINLLKKESFSYLEVNAGVIIGQIFILILIFSFRFAWMPIWGTWILSLPLVAIAVIFEIEYKNNKKLIVNASINK